MRETRPARFTILIAAVLICLTLIVCTGILLAHGSD